VTRSPTISVTINTPVTVPGVVASTIGVDAPASRPAIALHPATTTPR